MGPITGPKCVRICILPLSKIQGLKIIIKMDIKEEILFIIENLNVATAMYYEAWLVDLHHFHNPSPEINLNYQGYGYQSRRSSLMKKILEGEISTEELRFLKMQPQIKDFLPYTQTLNSIVFPTIIKKITFMELGLNLMVFTIKFKEKKYFT
jgi:hypothetical protein